MGSFMLLELEYLNHASVLLRLGSLRMLFDPWYEGTAFAGGWGLRYHNPYALERAASATHLWISHWHSDHFHVPTLQALQRRNPELYVLANRSANFSIAQRMRALGFRNVRELGERTPLKLSADVTVTRYPTAGIDNMLYIESPAGSIVNYNDCNLRPAALRALRRKLGRIDLLLTNYNHAGKLFDYRDPDLEKQALWGALVRVVDVSGAARVVPFASSHYYRVPASRGQNASLLDFDELEQRSRGDARFAVLRVGDRAQFARADARPELHPLSPRLPAQPQTLQAYGPSVAWDALFATAMLRCRRLQAGFPLLGYWLPPLRVAVSDLGRTLQLDLRCGASEAGGGEPHIAAHSRALQDWLGRPFGDDSFIAGAHFEVRGGEPSTLRRWVALSLLHASQLSVRDSLRYLATYEGVRFFWCRREEIVTSVRAGGLRAGQMRA